MSEEIAARVNKYILLIQAFLDQSLSVQDFESLYLRMFKSESIMFPSPLFALLNDLFIDVDAYCYDPALFNESSISEAQLRERCKATLDKLQRSET